MLALRSFGWNGPKFIRLHLTWLLSLEAWFSLLSLRMDGSGDLMLLPRA